MKYMMDTNICIYIIKHKPEAAVKNFLKHDPDEICISAITYAELMHGVEKSQAKERNRVAITMFLSPVSILQFSNRAAEEYGKVRAEFEGKRRRQMGIYVNIGNSGFAEINDSDYVDKSMLIDLINRTIGKKDKLTCLNQYNIIYLEMTSFISEARILRRPLVEVPKMIMEI